VYGQTVIEVIDISRIGLEFDSSHHRRLGRGGNVAPSQSAERPMIPAQDAGTCGEGFEIAAVNAGGALQAFAIHENHNSHKRFARSIFIFMPTGVIAARVSEKQRVGSGASSAPRSELDREEAAVSSRRLTETRRYKFFEAKWLWRKARWRSLEPAARLENHGKY
jgi:hypothetical protein